MKEDIIVTNTERFEKIKSNIKEEGAENLCLFADFDRTLTYGTVNGKKIPSMIAGLRSDNSYLGSDYVRKASLLKEKYLPIELDPTIGEKEKKETMEKWWEEHLELLIEKKLNKKHLKRVVDERVVRFRRDTKEVFYFLEKNGIPMVIISASGLGEEPISMMIERELGKFSNVYIISNSFFYDKDGNVTGYKKPLVNTTNKDNVLLDKKYFYNKIKDRKNLLLLGDSFDDIKMAENIEYKNLLKVCFLGEHTMERIEDYKNLYDILILNDSSMSFVKEFLENMSLKN